MRNANLLVAACDRIEKFELKIIAEILTPYRPTAASASPSRSTPKSREEALKNIGKTTHIFGIKAAWPAHTAATDTAFTKAVITRLHLCIREHLIGAVDLFERFFSTRLFVDIRVIFAGEATVSLFNLLLGAFAANTKNLVIVTRHRGLVS